MRRRVSAVWGVRPRIKLRTEGTFRQQAGTGIMKGMTDELNRSRHASALCPTTPEGYDLRGELSQITFEVEL
jgi:hypothetical protein